MMTTTNHLSEKRLMGMCSGAMLTTAADTAMIEDISPPLWGTINPAGIAGAMSRRWRLVDLRDGGLALPGETRLQQKQYFETTPQLATAKRERRIRDV